MLLLSVLSSLEHEASLTFTRTKGSIQRKKVNIPSITVTKMDHNDQQERSNDIAAKTPGVPIALCGKQPQMAEAFIKLMAPEYDGKFRTSPLCESRVDTECSRPCLPQCTNGIVRIACVIPGRIPLSRIRQGQQLHECQSASAESDLRGWRVHAV